jgi:trk system potassium uptake protein TrkH
MVPGLPPVLISSLGETRFASGKRRLSLMWLIGLGYLALIGLGAGLLLLPICQRDPGVSWLDCLFTATSAATLTGLVVTSTHDTWTVYGQLVLLVLIQLGGLGYMAGATIVALRIGLRVGLQQHLRLSDAPSAFSLHDAWRVARYVALTVFGLEAVGALLLTLRFAQAEPWLNAAYKGIFYAVSAFCNAGFDLAPGFSGLRAQRSDPWLLILLSVLIVLGGLGFGVLTELVARRTGRRLSLHFKLVLLATGVLLLLGWGHMLLFEWHNPATLGKMPVGQRVVNAWFLAVTPRTAGFSTVPTRELSPPTLFVTGLLMIVGASPDSTGGGVKTTTIAIIVLAILTLMRGRSDIELFRRRISGEQVRLALSLVSVYLAAVLLFALGISLTEGVHTGVRVAGIDPLTRFMQLVFETLSALSTGGQSTGVTPLLTAASRGLLIAAMLVGRLGPLAFVYLFAKPKRPQLRRLPEETVMTG